MDECTETVSAAFEIIASVGTAKSLYIEAVEKAKEGSIGLARETMKKGDEAFLAGHDVHLGLLQKTAAGSADVEISLILIHAEDQMASAETFKVLCGDLIDVYEHCQQDRC